MLNLSVKARASKKRRKKVPNASGGSNPVASTKISCRLLCPKGWKPRQGDRGTFGKSRRGGGGPCGANLSRTGVSSEKLDGKDRTSLRRRGGSIRVERASHEE